MLDFSQDIHNALAARFDKYGVRLYVDSFSQGEGEEEIPFHAKSSVEQMMNNGRHVINITAVVYENAGRLSIEGAKAAREKYGLRYITKTAREGFRASHTPPDETLELRFRVQIPALPRSKDLKESFLKDFALSHHLIGTQEEKEQAILRGMLTGEVDDFAKVLTGEEI